MKRKKTKDRRSGTFDGNLVAWAHARVMEAGERLKPLVARARGPELDVFDVKDLVGSAAPETVFATAAVVARTAADDDVVAVLLPTNLVGAKDPKRVLWGALLGSRSRRGRYSVTVWEARRAAEGPLVTRVESVENKVTTLADWMDATMFVDPEIEDLLASAGVEGALRRLKPPSVMAVANTTPTIAAQAPTPITKHALQQLGEIRIPWEAADCLADDLSDGGPGELLDARFMHVFAGDPAGLASRSFQDLVRNGWSTDAQAIVVMKKLGPQTDLLAALSTIGDAKLPLAAAASGLGRVAALALNRGDQALAGAAADVLVSRLDRAIADVGGQAAWLEQLWPRRGATLSDFVGTVLLGAAADAAVWSFTVAVFRSQPQDVPIARLETLRDGLLDRLDVPPGAAGERVVAAQLRVFRLLPSPTGERRIEVWKDHLVETSRAGKVDEALRAYGTYYATWLHSVATLARISNVRRDALQSQNYAAWCPDRVSTAGTLTRVWTVLARQCVLRACVEADAERALDLLLRARELAGNDDRYAWLANEARALAGRFDADLLRDLLEENRRAPTLGAAADLLRTAEALGERPAIAKAQRRLRSLAAGTGHEWMAEARITLARPIERADRARIARLVDGAPFGEIDPESRAVRALYGSPPDQRIREVREALRRQAEALDWAALVEEVRAEERRNPSPPAIANDAPVDAETAWLGELFVRLDAVWPTLPPNDVEVRREMRALADAASAASDVSARADVERRLTELLRGAVERQAVEPIEEDGEDDGFAPMTIDEQALEWSRRELSTPEWALGEACRQVTFFNLARGRRDRKMLRGTREDRSALWELRHRDGRHPVRVMYRYGERGPEVVAVLAKQDDAHQVRMIERVRRRIGG